nr:MAG TPA: hypothetical protein [Bacteriophage sp.]
MFIFDYRKDGNNTNKWSKKFRLGNCKSTKNHQMTISYCSKRNLNKSK